MDFRINTKVSTKSTGFSGTEFKPDLVGYEKRKRAREQEILQESLQDPKFERRKQLLDQRGQKLLNEKILRESYMDNYQGGRLTAFKCFMFEGFMDSLYLDDSFKRQHAVELYNVMENYIEGNGGMKLLENAPKTRFTKQLLEACNEIGKDCAEKCKEEKRDKVDWMKPNWNDSLFTLIKEKAEKDINNMSFDTLSKLVKDKVLTVVKDEKERSEAMKEFEEDVANEMDSAVSESINRTLHRVDPIEIPTLYNALMKESYNSILESAVTFFNNITPKDGYVGMSEDESRELDNIDDYSEDDIDWDSEDEEDIDDAFTTDKFDQGLEESEVESVKESTLPTESGKSVNMDHVMCEALTKYTLIEFMNTAKFTNLKSKDVKDMAMNLVYKK